MKMHGRKIPVRADFVSVHGLSAHADRDGLLRWTRGTGRPSAIFCVHGEPESAMALADLLRRELKSNVFAPRLGDEFELDSLLRD